MHLDLHLIIISCILLFLVAYCFINRFRRTKAFVSTCNTYTQRVTSNPRHYTTVVIKYMIDELEKEYKGSVHRKIYREKMGVMYSHLRNSKKAYRESILN